MKTCRVCQSTKALSDFYTDKSMTDGFRSACKECVKAARREYHIVHGEHARASAIAYSRTPKGRENRRTNQRKRMQSASFKAYQRAWSKTEKGRASGRSRVNRFAKTTLGDAANKRRHVARRARERIIINTLTANEWAVILSAHDNRCRYCGRAFSSDLPPTQDHVMPISKGGHHTKDNVVPACKPCNSRKRDRLWQTS